MFVVQRKSLFLFLQGHPEYDSGALFREYRRDVERFLGGARSSYPKIPRGYFNEDTEAAFAEFREEALRHRDIGLLSSFPAVGEGKLVHVWREPAICIYSNWLAYLLEQRSQNHRPVK
jgi:homoserine O-succinyltransferase